jgi:short-subunit dehydrogenase involved in D-alanine esterification of teichoic acids
VIICARTEATVKEAVDKLKGYKVEGYSCDVADKVQR